VSECSKHERDRRQGSPCPYCHIAALEAKHDTSELLHEIDELNRHNKVLQKADMHREKIWKKRVAELETQLANFESDAYVLSLLTKIDELEAELAEKPAYHCPKCDSWFSEGELKALAGERLTIRQVHRNGVECVHGRFLHERCDLCEGETK